MSKDKSLEQEIINELEQIDDIVSARGVVAVDKLTALNKYIKVRLAQLKQTSIKEREE